MKRSIILISLTALMMAGCHHKTDTEKEITFSTHEISGRQCYQLIFEEETGPWGDSVGMMLSYSVAWPDKDVLSPAAEKALLYFYFGDSTCTIEEAAQRWLSNACVYSDEESFEKKPIDTIDEESDYSYVSIESECKQEGTLATFFTTREGFTVGAAHGMHFEDYLTIDLASGKVLQLTDLIADTSLLCETIAHAIQDLEENNGIIGCLFDEFIDVKRMPLPHNFSIDIEHKAINVYYGLYEIAPYACGIQEVTLPVLWLSERVPLTSYAQQLFGMESAL